MKEKEKREEEKKGQRDKPDLKFDPEDRRHSMGGRRGEQGGAGGSRGEQGGAGGSRPYSS